ncbi:hypothetical protein BGY98DRAFT_327074 [Russula aff. rugulosa BPL654]|nr:hypothetical protein BGY98DRAFT_327074 [Russula aff. rugulosa BPL654]
MAFPAGIPDELIRSSHRYVVHGVRSCVVLYGDDVVSFLSLFRRQGWILHYGRSVPSYSFIERIAILVISFSSYLDVWHSSDFLRPVSKCSRSTGSQRSSNDTNIIVAQHPTAPSLIVIPITVTLWPPL